MSELFTDELDAYELTVAANVVGERSDSTIIRAIVENGTGAEFGPFTVVATPEAGPRVIAMARTSK